MITGRRWLKKNVKSYHDSHPCIVTDEDSSIQVFVDGTGKYKGTSSIAIHTTIDD